MAPPHTLRITSILALLTIALAGCRQLLPVAPVAAPVDPGATAVVTATPFRPVDEPSATPPPTPALTPPPAARLWISPAVPAALRDALAGATGLTPADERGSAALALEPAPDDAPQVGSRSTTWIYTLVAPFPTVADGVTVDELRAAWAGAEAGPFAGRPLLAAPETLAAFATLWGAPAEGAVRALPAGELLDAAWQARPAWALIPFEAIGPRWKVLAVDGQSPLHKEFDAGAYPLKVRFDLSGAAGDAALAERLPATNRDASRLTVLVMTGTTALVRGTAAKMDRHGVDYPAGDIGGWLRDADLAHISNEVPFYADCPPADPFQVSLRFCSDPRNIQLLEAIGVDLIELTGNHVNDYGVDALRYTIDLYRERGWPYFGGGLDLDEARRPLLIEDHGNRLAFLGCNPVGPVQAWATEDEPGAAPCDYDALKAEILRLRDAGYLPVVTLQYNEYYILHPSETQERDFRALAGAGAVIVSGSQAHFPQGMGFSQDTFIHYGLGNLFFDQMDYPVVGTRREFLDRHVFYDGRYLGTELLTAMLEDYARPRPMDDAERAAFLEDIFAASGWDR